MIKQTVVFDFDGVISTYENGWQGVRVINDEPVEGIREVMLQIKEEYKIVILSSRCSSEKGREVLMDWLDEYAIPYDEITDVKPKALVYIDDRAICFRGNTAFLYKEVQQFEPWNNKLDSNIKYLPQPGDVVEFKLFNDEDSYVGEVLYEYKITNHQNIDCNNLYFYCIRSSCKTYNIPAENIKKRIK